MHHQLPAQRNIAALEDGRICRVTEYIYEKHFQKEMVDPDGKGREGGILTYKFYL